MMITTGMAVPSSRSAMRWLPLRSTAAAATRKTPLAKTAAPQPALSTRLIFLKVGEPQ
jgi:hypothetical protein